MAERCADWIGADGSLLEEVCLFCKGEGCEVRFVRTTALKHHREIDESASAKSDQRDALTLTNITREASISTR